MWFQDEARVGQQNTSTRIWAEKGTRPRVVKQQQFESAYLFGAVCPAKDIGVALVLPVANTEAMRLHLTEISKAISKGRHGLVIVDQAAWHTTHCLEIPANITLLKLPPASPELNPVERIWEKLREDSLANRCFKNFNDIVESCCEAWNVFVNKKNNIKSLCSRCWAVLTS
ncbi:IS630 family transposase [Spartinivicinus marinus]|uniref:IS630 family transposase n=1 Tax=Spartinivicinus marinus TaxID=2994442 RepID=UPI002258E74E|nr:IS630 family transposase [Spartinivicinus marinus]